MEVGPSWRYILTFSTAISSNTQPVKAILPRTVEPSTGVANCPKGWDELPGLYTFNIAVIVCGELEAVVELIVMVPVYCPADSPEAFTEAVTSLESEPEEAPPEVFTIRADGTVHSAMSDSSDQWWLEGDGIVIESTAGSQRLEIIEYDGNRMKWALAVGEMLIVYHLVRTPAE